MRDQTISRHRPSHSTVKECGQASLLRTTGITTHDPCVWTS